MLRIADEASVGNLHATQMKVSSGGITFSDGTVQTSKGEEPLTFATGVNLSLNPTPGSILRDVANPNQVVYTPPTLNAAAVGLGNVNNTSDSAKPVSTLQQTALDDKANLSGATFTGNVHLEGSAVGIQVVRPGGQSYLNLKNSTSTNTWQFSGPIVTSHSTAGADNCLLLTFYAGSTPTNCATFRKYNTQGDLILTGGIYTYLAINTSDDRVKHNEEDISGSLAVIRKLRPQVYDKTATMGDDQDLSGAIREAGFIAQEVAEIPELLPYVDVGNDTELWGLNYNSVFTYAVAGLKELDAIVQVQQTKIENLEARLTALETAN